MRRILPYSGCHVMLVSKMIFPVFFCMLSLQLIAQAPTAGDYRSRANGNWATASTWQVRDGSGNWTTATVAPTSTTNVYIQLGHTITATAAGNCGDLHMAYNSSLGTRGILNLGTNVLNINGKIRSYTGTVITSAVDGTFYSSQAGNSTIPENLINTSGTGKVKFVGTTRNLTIAGEWGTFGTAFAVEFALNAGETGTLNTGFKSYSVLFSSGIVNTLANRMAADNGSADGGNMVISNGATLITGEDIKRTGSSRSGTLTIASGGTLILTAVQPVISFKTLVIDPNSTVVYGLSGFQYFSNFNYSGDSLLNYGNLILDGSSNKQVKYHGVDVRGNFEIKGTAALRHDGYPISIEKNWTQWGTNAYSVPTNQSDTVRFSGSGTQQISCPGTINFKWVSKTGTGTVTQLADINVGTATAYLGIENGTWDAGTYALSAGSATSLLSLNNNTTLLLGITGVSLPQFAGSNTFNTGSTLVLKGNGAQQLKGGIDYKNLTFTGSTYTTLVSNPASIVGTVTINSSTAVLDIGNSNGFGDGNTNLTMTAGRFKMSGTTPKPEIDGVYSLTGGVIEFNGSSATRQNIKGKTASGSTNINYWNIEVTGTNVGMGAYNIGITSNALCSFTVKTGATFTISSNTITSTAGPSLAKVVVESGALFNCGNNKGFHGFTQLGLNSSSINSVFPNSSVELKDGSTVSYIKDGDQDITNTVPYYHLIIEGNLGTKTASALVTTVKGDFTKNGSSVFSHNGGTVLFNNTTTPQHYICTSSDPVTFSTLQIQKGSSNPNRTFFVEDNMNIEDNLEFSASSLFTLVDGDVTFKSSSTKTARFAEVKGANTKIDYTGTGLFIVERYINLRPSGAHGKSWQLLSIPVKTTQTINAAWQEGNVPLGNTKPGYGTIITNSVPGTGFDVIGGVAPSMKYYIPATNSWKGVTRTDTAINSENGYMIFIRGDRSVSTIGASPTTTVMRTRGKIFYNTTNSLDKPPAVTVPNNLFQSIGNPYASAISFDAVTKTKVQHIFYVWDPRLTGIHGYGAYQTFFENPPNSGNYEILLGGGSYGPMGSYDDRIESGQTFFVHSDGTGNGSIAFPENSKVSGSVLVTRTPNPQYRNGHIYAKLISLGQEVLPVDAVKIEFGLGYNDHIDQLDVLKMNNDVQNLAILLNQRDYSVERRSLPKQTDSIQLKISSLYAQDYQMDLTAGSWGNIGVKPYLIDRFANTLTAIPTSDTIHYEFTVSASQPASYAQNRFSIVFKEKKKIGLPSDMPTSLAFNAVHTNRLSATGDATTQCLGIYPNPVRGNQAVLEFNQFPSGKYRIEISDLQGRLLKTEAIQINSRLFSPELYVGDIPSGTYLINVKGNHYIGSLKLVLER